MSGLRTEICTDPVAFEQLASAWDDLLDRSASRSIFLSWGWLFAWWTQFGALRELRLILVRDSTDRLVGIAPLLLGREGILGSLRVVRFLGTEAVSSDYLDFIVDPALEQEVVAAIWEALASSASSWDWIRLTDLLDDSLAIGPARALATGQGFASDVVPRQTCPYLALPATRDGYWKALKPGMRNNVRRKVRQLEAVGVVFETTEAAADLPAALEQFYRIHGLRWRSKGLTGNFHDPRVRAFHTRVAEHLAPRGRMRLYWLSVGGRGIAAIYALEYKGVLSDYQTGFEPAPPDPSVPAAKYSPGVVLIARCLEDAIDRRSTEFDFLRGPEPYKFEWTRTYRRTFELTLVGPRNTTALARFWALLAERRGRAAIKRLLGRRPVAAPEIAPT